MFAYTLFHLGQALAHNIESLLVCRFFSGFFGVAPLAVDGGKSEALLARLPRPNHMYDVLKVYLPTYGLPQACLLPASSLDLYSRRSLVVCKFKFIASTCRQVV